MHCFVILLQLHLIFYGVSSRFIGLRQRGGHLTLATSSKDSPQWQNVLTAITIRPQWGGLIPQCLHYISLCHCHRQVQLDWWPGHCHPVKCKSFTALLSLTQNISTGLAVAGVVVIARSIRLVREKVCTFYTLGLYVLKSTPEIKYVAGCIWYSAHIFRPHLKHGIVSLLSECYINECMTTLML